MLDYAEMDRHLQKLAVAAGRTIPSTDYVRRYTDRLGPQHAEDLAVAVEVFTSRQHFPSPGELREEVGIARLARLRLETAERGRYGPPRTTAPPEVVRSRLAAMRRKLAEAKGPTALDLYADGPAPDDDPVLATARR